MLQEEATGRHLLKMRGVKIPHKSQFFKRFLVISLDI